jgi:diguanylate cyclase (GGDEF)-like protein
VPRTFISKRDILAVAGLAMLAIAVLGIGVVTSKTVKEVHLMRDAEMTAMRWARLFEDRRDDLMSLFRERRTADHVDSLIWNSHEVGRVIAYDLYDRDGRRFYSTGAADWLPDEMSGGMLDSPVTRKHMEAGIPTTRLHSAGSTIKRAHYASVVIPLDIANEHIGSVIAFVDQTEQARSLTHSFGIIATATVILLLTALGAAAYVVISKSRERLQAESRLQYLTEHDELTGLPNRQCFNRQLEDRFADETTAHSIALLFIDIDRFKEVNSALGHSAGDAVLRCVAERLKANIGRDDFAGRLGSNEFALALSSAPTPKKIAAFVTRLREILGAPFWVGGEEVACTFSMGVALAPGDGKDQPTLARHANLALTRARSEGHGGFKYFERSMDIAFQRRREREQDLRNALERNELEVQFQPQFCAASGAMCGQEALLRWNHPQHGTISPAYFVPLAEETELIVPIGEWVLRRACEEAVSWDLPLNVAVNLSPVQFKNGDISSVVARILEETGLAPQRLELEITENMLIRDTEPVISQLNKLHDLGVAIAMDDFGTGYSSLSYISSFPFNKIKIDKAFIHAMTSDEALNAIVKCIIAMGQSLGVTITAEGVETEEQARILRRYGCHQIQGYLYGRPVSAADCARQITQADATANAGSRVKSKSKSAA